MKLQISKANLISGLNGSVFNGWSEFPDGESLTIRIFSNITHIVFPTGLALISNLIDQEELYCWMSMNKAREFIFSVDTNMNPIVEIHTASEDKVFVVELEDDLNCWTAGFHTEGWSETHQYPVVSSDLDNLKISKLIQFLDNRIF